MQTNATFSRLATTRVAERDRPSGGRPLPTENDEIWVWPWVGGLLAIGAVILVGLVVFSSGNETALDQGGVRPKLASGQRSGLTGPAAPDMNPGSSRSSAEIVGGSEALKK